MTYLLALETSGFSGSVALLYKGELLAAVSIPEGQGTAQGLHLAVEKVASLAQVDLKQISLICVTQGPGSFTGLRFGVTAAKVLAYSLSAELVGVNTLEALALAAVVKGSVCQEGGEPEKESMTFEIEAILNAHRRQLFTATFELDRQETTEEKPLVVKEDTRIVDTQSWISSHEEGLGKEFSRVVTGSGLEKVEEEFPGGNRAFVERSLWQATAEFVGQVGYRHWLAGKKHSPYTFLPKYFRKSAAEEQAEKSV
ncbi:MAG: tRNA (adenosine(37)-N6)-threonylcarbamoyltransferase complex dimerization subunit type 1 TsaB [Pirellulaceae bacterium]|nr:tRNA (adenosine(37)-N6)-threonylcarbamoyltransferase complex dimerization subunit type 1 TsaB [Pirellulaceae bacterium]